MAKKALAKKLESIRSSKFFGILDDEFTDISNKELLSMCFWWIKDLRVHADFVAYYELRDIKSDIIVNAVKDSLIRMQLSPNDSKTQAYDGASVTIFHQILINPATSCIPERSFSVGRRIKTWLCWTMTTKRFNNLYILPLLKELTDISNLVNTGNKFA